MGSYEAKLTGNDVPRSIARARIGKICQDNKSSCLNGSSQSMVLGKLARSWAYAAMITDETGRLAFAARECS